MNTKNKFKRISLLLTAVILLSACSLFFSSCGMRTSTHDEESGLSFYQTADKDGYYVQADNAKTDYVIPDEYKGKPVVGIVENGFSADNYTSIVVPSSLVYVGPEGLSYVQGCKYNEYGGGYYLGNDENPYVILVYAFGESVTVADGCKSIIDDAISDTVCSLTISASVEYIAPKAFDSAAVYTTDNGLSGLLNVSVADGNSNYKSVDNKQVLNKEGTRLLCLCPYEGISIPSTVEFIEAGAIIGGYAEFIPYDEDGSFYIPSDDNPYFLLIYAANDNIRDGVKVISGYACQNGDFVVPDSVVQLMPLAFYGNNVTATVTSEGWFNADEYMDGMAYDMAISGAKYDKDFKATTVYLKEGEYEKIIVENPPFVNWNHNEFRRYEN